VRRERGPDGKSRFSLTDLEAIGRRSRARAPAELPIESGLTVIQDGSIFYRGEDVLTLARFRGFEEVANWLWVGIFPEIAVWRSGPEMLAVATAIQAVLPAGTLPLDRLKVSCAALPAADPLRYNTNPEAVVVTARRLLAALVDSLPVLARPDRDTLAARLWARLCPSPPPVGGVEALNAGLVLAADHELSTSTLTARVAASIQADPYAVVTVGLSALGGAMQSVASLAAESLLAGIGSPEDAPRVIGDRLREGRRLPGFGHALHPSGDPRAGLLLDMVREAYAGSARLAVVEAIVSATRERGLPAANIDFALAALASVAGMVRGSSEAVFALGRSAGWLAHAIEEYGRRSAIRPRAIYVGVPVGPER
jgi:citrate synthase